jgi:transposase-like protein
VSRLLDAEQEVLRRGGRVIRLAGLYSLNRGAHTYWLQQTAQGKTIETNANGVLNLIHYEDAARFVVAALEAGE